MAIYEKLTNADPGNTELQRQYALSLVRRGTLRDDKTPGPLTSDKNLLRHRVFRGDGGDA